MTPDQSRLEADRATPRLVALWQALVALKTPLHFMQSGAHPDDETSTMLAALRFRDGIGISYVCSTRGEGGQNDIGQQKGAALGVLRTAEMEAAAARLDLHMYWLSQSPDDPITDFGFSKLGTETLARWGRERTLQRFVEVVRRARPDMLCPTFLDVPGQHGHHRAMTELAHDVIDAAADVAFETPGLEPWRISKLYLPAWSGAGQAYDDDLPPPDATVTVTGTGRDPVTGFTWERMGQHSRAMHATQGMGRWPSEGRDFPLHLVGGDPESAITDDLPRSMADLEIGGGAAIQQALDTAVQAFPDADAVITNAARALTLLRQCNPDPKDAHRVDAKIRQLNRVLYLASGAEVRAAAGHDWIGPDDDLVPVIETYTGSMLDVSARVLSPRNRQPDGYRDTWLPLDPPLPALDVSGRVGGENIRLRLPFDRTPAYKPSGVTVVPRADVINLTTGSRRAPLRLSRPGATLSLPAGWIHQDGILSVPDAPGTFALTVMQDDDPALFVETITAPHTAPRVLATPAMVRIAVIEADLPAARIGYIGAGRDPVAHWMTRMGLDVTELSDAQLADPHALADFDTLVIGIFALRFRRGLTDRMPAMHNWIHAGGTLLTLYHRPWDNWEPETTPPARLEIGQPSLRWRVTDPDAVVTHLAPDHPILTGPNPIGPDDWAGWDKERGLYFAKSWDASYVPLLSMSDAGEDPLHGALLSAEIGKGRHTHCALILHHQMEALVPGAFRLMANLVAPRR